MKTFVIDSGNHHSVRNYIQHQFDQLSWWPTEGPFQAREAFAALDGSPAALNQWCLEWLNAGQWRQMRVALRNDADAAK
jgi:hypothetical protein